MTELERGQRLVDVAHLPLLGAEEGVADDPLAVDGVERRALPQREQARLDLVSAEDLELGVGEAGEGKLAGGCERLRFLDAAGGEGEDLDGAPAKLFVPPAQLRQVPPAERSPISAHEHEQHGRLAPELGEAHRPPAGREKREIRRLGSDADAPRLGRHHSSAPPVSAGASRPLVSATGIIWVSGSAFCPFLVYRTSIIYRYFFANAHE